MEINTACSSGSCSGRLLGRTPSWSINSNFQGGKVVEDSQTDSPLALALVNRDSARFFGLGAGH